MRFHILAAAAVLVASPALADGEVNIYTSRHYDTDESLYTDFTAATGIEVNRIDAGADELIERLKAEGEASPADIFITTDAGRMWRAEQAGVLGTVQSDVLDAAIPAHLRHPEGKWFGVSLRARIIFYDKERVAEPPQTYADLADPKYKGLICTRSSSNIYMLSLLASRIAHDGEEAAKAWAEGLKANLARDPQGGDTDQLRGIVSGECAIAVANTYYFARSLRKEVDGLTGSTDQIGWVFPDQEGAGAHVNVSAAAITAHSPNRDNAILFLEYLVSQGAQEYFANGNDEYPVVAGVAMSSSVQGLGEFKADKLGLEKLGEFQTRAQEIYNEVGYE